MSEVETIYEYRAFGTYSYNGYHFTINHEHIIFIDGISSSYKGYEGGWGTREDAIRVAKYLIDERVRNTPDSPEG